mmetsp:Transcript_24429/g.36252  ORF Transcript_24429/g.36252 Transcript_24429/m.36252 type:complete len:100 (-) Transcript_24429:29-328(-)
MLSKHANSCRDEHMDGRLRNHAELSFMGTEAFSLIPPLQSCQVQWNIDPSLLTCTLSLLHLKAPSFCDNVAEVHAVPNIMRYSKQRGGKERKVIHRQLF